MAPGRALRDARLTWSGPAVANRGSGTPDHPVARLERQGLTATPRLTGDWIASETGIRSAAEVTRILDEADAKTLRLDATRIGRWDSALISLLKMLRDCAGTGRTQPVQIDNSDLPETARRLFALVSPGAPEASGTKTPPPSLTTRVGETYFVAWSKTVELATLLGETALRGAATFAGRRARA